MAMLNNQMVIFDNLLIISGWWCNNHLEKYDFVNGKDDIPYMKWKIKFMFETTNQPNISHYSPHDNTYFTNPVPMRNFGCDGEVVYTKWPPKR